MYRQMSVLLPEIIVYSDVFINSILVRVPKIRPSIPKGGTEVDPIILIDY